MEHQSTQSNTQDIFLETVLKVNEKAPKRYKLTKKFLKSLEQELEQSTSVGSPVTDRTHRELVKIIASPIDNVRTLEQAEERVSAVGELIVRDPGLFHTLMGIDTDYSRSRKERLEELLRAFIHVSGKAAEERIKKEVPELPAYEAGSAIAHVGDNLTFYCGEVEDVRGFVRWAFVMAVIQAKKLAFVQNCANGSLRKSIYAGILSKLKNATDLCPLDYADDLYGQILDLLWREKAEEFLLPGTASLETRLRKLGERHTQIYLKSLIDKRKSVEANKHRIDCGKVVSDAELKALKKKENRERRLRYNSRRSISDMQ